MILTNFIRKDGSTARRFPGPSWVFLEAHGAALGEMLLAPTYLSFSLSRTIFVFYANNVLVSNHSMTLARQEMTMVLASLFLKYDLYCGQKGPTLELYDTIRARDIDANRDYIISLPAKESLGLRVKIRN
jgi:hypothetical protein